MFLPLEKGGFTLKGSEGFTLIELISSLLVFFVITTALLPILSKVYIERMMIKEDLQTMEMLSTIMQEWLYDNKELPNNHHVIVRSEVTYFITKRMNGADEIELCFRWDGRNDRAYVRCAYGKK